MDILDCFAVEAIPDGCITMYDTDHEHTRIWYAKEVDGKVRIGTHKVQGKRILVPLIANEIFTHDQQVDVACELLLQMARWFPLMQSLSEVQQDAFHHFGKRDLALATILTSNDHNFIPPGIALAVAEPAYVGRIAHLSNATGIVLFNRKSIRSYRYRLNHRQRGLYESLEPGVGDYWSPDLSWPVPKDPGK